VLTRHSLLGDDEIWLDCNDGVANLLDLLLLNLQNPIPVVLLGDLDVGLGLSLLVLKRAVEKHNTRVLYAPAHLGVCDVLVQHNTVQNTAVLDLASRDLLDSGIALDIDLSLAVARLPGHGAHGFEGQGDHLVHPPRDELGADGGGDELVHGLVVVDVDRVGDLVDDGEGVLEGPLEGRDDDDGVDVALKLREGMCQDFTSYVISSAGWPYAIISSPCCCAHLG
jgi:hypothetical protein